MNKNELSSHIADELERKARVNKMAKVNLAEEYYKGYEQACEDFARMLRQSKED